MKKMDKIAWIMALPHESQGLFEKQNIPLHFCGVGKVNATFKTTQLILETKPEIVFNLGTAGSHKFRTHTLVECCGYVQRDMDLSPLGLKVGETPWDDIPSYLPAPSCLRPDLQQGICGTGDRFEIQAPSIGCDLVDMEAYAMAKVCKLLNVPFYSFKYITDGSDENAHKSWKENLKAAAEKLYELYLSLKSPS